MQAQPAVYQSSEFDPSAGPRWFPNGVGIFNNQIFVVGGGNDGPGRLGMTTAALTASGIIAMPRANWMSNQTDDLPRVDGRCAIVTPGANMFLFGNGGNGPFASSYDLQSRTGPDWTKPVAWLQDSSGHDVRDGYHDVDATVFGQSGVLVGCAGIPVNGSSTLYLGYYDPGDLAPGVSSWKARWSAYLTAADLSRAGLPVSDPGEGLSLDWFSGAADGKIQYRLALFMTPEGNQGRVSVLYTLPFTVDKAGVVNGIEMSAGANGASAWQVPNANAHNGCVARDPGGRVNLYYFNDSDQMQVLLLDTFDFRPDRAPTFTTSTRQVSNNNIAPTVKYWIAPPVDNKAVAYELIFYASDLRAQVNAFGTAEVMPNCRRYAARPGKGPNAVKYIVEGIFDGPIPYPNVNSQTYVQDFAEYAEPGKVVYGSSDENSVGHEQSFDWTVGVQTSMTTTKGIGLNYEVSANGGTNWGSGDESGTTMSNAKSQSAAVDPKTKTIDPHGTLVCNSVDVVVTAYKFTDTNGVLVSGPRSPGTRLKAPLSFSMAPIFSPGTPQSFLPYAVSPGDLASYTPEGINKRMRRLGYTGANYFGEIIIPNAYEFKTGVKGITCIWTNEGFKDVSRFEAIHSSFKEFGWSFDSHVSIGVGAGFGVEVFGIGEDVETSIMANLSVSLHASTKTSTSSSWGLGLDEGWTGPPPSHAKNAITSYTFKIVFLPPPPEGSKLPANYWAAELIQYAGKVDGQRINPANVDPKSECWRVMYVVTHYESRDKSSHYTYKNDLGVL